MVYTPFKGAAAPKEQVQARGALILLTDQIAPAQRLEKRCGEFAAEGQQLLCLIGVGSLHQHLAHRDTRQVTSGRGIAKYIRSIGNCQSRMWVVIGD